MNADQLTQLTASVKELTELVQEAIKAQQIENEDLEPGTTKRWKRREGQERAAWEDMPPDVVKNKALVIDSAFSFLRQQTGTKEAAPLSVNGVVLIPRNLN